MENFTPEEAKKFRTELWLHSDQSAVEFAKWAIQSLFLFSGSIATVLFAKQEEMYHSIARIFALSAGIAVLCFGLAYVYQMIITYRHGCELQNIKPNKILAKFTDNSAGAKAIAIIWTFSFGASVWGIISIWMAM